MRCWSPLWMRWWHLSGIDPRGRWWKCRLKVKNLYLQDQQSRLGKSFSSQIPRLTDLEVILFCTTITTIIVKYSTKTKIYSRSVYMQWEEATESKSLIQFTKRDYWPAAVIILLKIFTRWRKKQLIIKSNIQSLILMFIFSDAIRREISRSDKTWISITRQRIETKSCAPMPGQLVSIASSDRRDALIVSYRRRQCRWIV